ncbi:MAG: hypothetical protein COS35_10455 [Zetaproteobacteria bacterium CG02_land_8_20_14_3_00_50_9]|nr:MAG: hypothetical protein COS35_10455 [Zetaproteobacteria bacterium CG02_land_8_20_14_3_00_50_9]
MLRDGNTFTNLSVLPDLYVKDENETISRTATGYHWKDRASGDWVDYDASGRFTASGHLNITVAHSLYDPYGKLTGILDARGRQVLWYSYSGNNISSVHDAANRSVSYQYDAAGRITTFTDVLGHAWHYQYNTKGYLVKRTDPLGRTLSIIYAADGKTASVKDQDGIGASYQFSFDDKTREYYMKEASSGQVREYWYSSGYHLLRRKVNGQPAYTVQGTTGKNIQQITDASGHTVTEEYDDSNNVIKRTYADGTTQHYTWHQDYDLPLSETNENGITTRFTYDAYANLISKTEADRTPLARSTDYSYDAYGQLISTTRAGITTSFTYDPYGNRQSTTDALGNITSFTYDMLGNPLTITDALENVWRSEYDAAGNLLKRIDPQGHATTYAYDAASRRISETDANGNITTYAYDNQDRLTTITDAAGGITRMEYDKSGNMIRQTDGEGHATTFAYDAMGRMTTVTDGNGNVIRTLFNGAGYQPQQMIYPTFTRSMGYDLRNRLVASIDQLDASTNRTVRYGYDLAGNRISTTDPAGRITRYAYDAQGRLTTVTDPAGGVTAYTYDAQDNLLKVTDANGHDAFRYEYDNAGRKTKELRPMGQFSSFAYDMLGRLTGKTDALNHTISYDYSPSGRLLAIHYPAANGIPAKDVSFSYDANGNRTAYNDGTTSGAYTYDTNNQKLTDAVNYGAFTLSSSYAYDKTGRKTSFTGPDGATITYAYDTGNLLKSINIPGQGLIDYYSYNWVAPSKVILPGGSTKNYAYDGLLRVTDIHMQDAYANTLMHYSYAYDNVGNITLKSTEHGQYLYGYDTLDRLVSANYPTQANEAFAYDKVGNRIVHNNDVQNPWSYNANNELLSRPNVSYTYDANGSQIQKTENGVTSDYLYNGNNRLTQIRQGTTTIADYDYDPFGRRLSKTVNGITSYFKYSDEGLTAEADSTGKITQSYGYKPNSTWGTDPLYMSINGAYHFYLNDHLGTPQQLATTIGSQSWAAIYEAFGKATVTASSVTSNLRFPGQYEDAKSGYHYNLFRIYDNGTGGYIKTDPIGMKGGMNLYLYANSNPLVYMDSLGLFDDGRNNLGVFNPLGHSDFYGGDRFDYVKEDYGLTSPFTLNPFILQLHFRNVDDVEKDLAYAVKYCSKDYFERLMHQGQDYFSHYRNGYRWYTAGHLFAGHTPDRGFKAQLIDWFDAQRWTMGWVEQWDKNNCDCKYITSRFMW